MIAATEERPRDLAARDAARGVRVEQQHDGEAALARGPVDLGGQQGHRPRVSGPGGAPEGVDPARAAHGARDGAGVGGSLDDDERVEAREVVVALRFFFLMLDLSLLSMSLFAVEFPSLPCSSELLPSPWIARQLPGRARGGGDATREIRRRRRTEQWSERRQ